MRLFVSYSRRDNSPQRLADIDRHLRTLGDLPYIDDIHHPAVGDRRHAVLDALSQADVFVVIDTPTYLQTAWTRLEFEKAMEAGLPISILSAGAELRPSTYETLLADAARLKHPDPQALFDHAPPGLEDL